MNRSASLNGIGLRLASRLTVPVVQPFRQDNIHQDSHFLAALEGNHTEVAPDPRVEIAHVCRRHVNTIHACHAGVNVCRNNVTLASGQAARAAGMYGHAAV